MDGRGRALDNGERLWRSVKYETSISSSTTRCANCKLGDYFDFYNHPKSQLPDSS